MSKIYPIRIQKFIQHNINQKVFQYSFKHPSIFRYLLFFVFSAIPYKWQLTLSSNQITTFNKTTKIKSVYLIGTEGFVCVCYEMHLMKTFTYYTHSHQRITYIHTLTLKRKSTATILKYAFSDWFIHILYFCELLLFSSFFSLLPLPLF